MGREQYSESSNDGKNNQAVSNSKLSKNLSGSAGHQSSNHKGSKK